jgi:hypothetical protein
MAKIKGAPTLRINAESVVVIQTGVTQTIVIFKPTDATLQALGSDKFSSYLRLELVDGPKNHRMTHIADKLHKRVSGHYESRTLTFVLTVI